QAEDGIRAFHVTGVQTCALPIYAARDVACANRGDDELVAHGEPLLVVVVARGVDALASEAVDELRDEPRERAASRGMTDRLVEQVGRASRRGIAYVRLSVRSQVK